jgi:hypothetical protein
MDKDELLAILSQDDAGLLKIKPKPVPSSTEDERLVSSFDEVQAYVREHAREPQANMSDMHEYKLHKRLAGLRADPSKVEKLVVYDDDGLLEIPPIESIDDIFNNDAFGILDDGEDSIFTLNHVPKQTTMPDDIAKRKKCNDFDEFKHLFEQCHLELKDGKRQMVQFSKEQQIQKGLFFILKGILLYVADKGELEKRGKKTNARLRCIFENGTESNMLLRSLASELYKDGRRVTSHEDRQLDGFDGLTDEDQSTGYIYILKSLSQEPEIQGIHNLFKIGHTRLSVDERIKNAENEPTYLMAPVKLVSSFKCYNLDSHKFEQLLHTFFGSSCLSISIAGNDGKMHSPREWFIAPIDVINTAVKMLVSGDIVNYRYDQSTQKIIGK